MKKERIIKLSIIALILMLSMILTGGQVEAALQANPSTQYTKTDTLANWVKNIRAMEAAGGAMGLSETIGSDLTASTSNNIDVHLMRTTEYGAMAILSASGYGNPSNDKAITSTTGNSTGVILNTSNWEWTAGVTGSSTLSGVNARYYDLYETSNTSAKVGDALGTADTTNPGCAGWHSASYSSWVTSSLPGFVRGNGGVFSFDINVVSNGNFARAVVVSGAGL